MFVYNLADRVLPPNLAVALEVVNQLQEPSLIGGEQVGVVQEFVQVRAIQGRGMIELPERSSAGRGALGEPWWKVDGRMRRGGVDGRGQWRNNLESCG